MKLAEALLLRADLQKRIEQIKNSIRPSNNEVLKLSVAIKNSIEENRKRCCCIIGFDKKVANSI